MSAGKPFFDTNVLLYLYSSNATKADRAQTLLEAGSVISVQVLNEFALATTRKLAMRIDEVRESLAVIRAVCTVRPLDIETHELGLDIVQRYRFAIYDGMIIAAALQARCGMLYSEDFNDGQVVEGMAIRNPFR